MKTITLLPERDYKLINSHIFFFTRGNYASNTEWGLCSFSGTITKTPNGQNRHKITHSTNSILNVTQLDRTLFVKKEDVEELAVIEARKFLEEHLKNKKQDYRIGVSGGFAEGFIAGYNTKKGEFTREEMEQAINYLSHIKENYPKHIFEEQKEKFFNNLRPISLPTSIIVDESYDIIKLNW